MLCLNITNITIITVKSNNYRFIISEISKSDSIHFLGNYVLEDRGSI